MSCWNPEQYLRFASQRTRPAFELAARLAVAAPRRIIDLGCGPGNSTGTLQQRWGEAAITGLDISPQMITKAGESYPQLNWIVGDIATWAPESAYEIVFSNAALHWVSDHSTLIPRLFRHVSSGGALAAQIPFRLASIAHQLMLDVANHPKWNDRTRSAVAAFSNETPLFYYDLLQPIASHLDVWVTEYYHVLDSPKAIIGWLRDTGLRPVLDTLDGAREREHFERLLLDRYEAAFCRRVDGRVLFPLPRMFIIAYKAVESRN